MLFLILIINTMAPKSHQLKSINIKWITPLHYAALRGCLVGKSLLIVGWPKSLLYLRIPTTTKQKLLSYFKRLPLLWLTPVVFWTLNWQGQQCRNIFFIKVKKDSVGWLFSINFYHLCIPSILTFKYLCSKISVLFPPITYFKTKQIKIKNQTI